MITRLLITILLVGINISSYSQISIIGKWRRVNPNQKSQNLENKQLQWGDLEIRSDSTFHIQGANAKKTSTIPGWHAGQNYEGTWEKNDNSHLSLWMSPKNDKMFLSYKIIRLTNDKLLLKILPDLPDSKYNVITYLRL